MKNLNTIEVKKRNSESVAAWRVDVGEVTPNTVIDPDNGVTVLVKINGQKKLVMGKATVVNSLMNPGKGAKLLFGNKPYEKVEMSAIDQSSDFSAEWALAGPNAIPAHDEDLDVDCNVIARGQYYYKVENFVNFFGAFPFDSEGVITRHEIREFLRATTSGIIKGYLTAAISANGVKGCQTSLAECSQAIKDKINMQLDSKGLTVYDFVIESLAFDSNHANTRSEVDKAKVDVRIRGINNVGARDDLTVRQQATDIDISVIRARGEAEGTAVFPNQPRQQREVTYVYCSRCGEKNVSDSHYCKKCGEKLSK